MVVLNHCQKTQYLQDMDDPAHIQQYQQEGGGGGGYAAVHIAVTRPNRVIR